MLTALIGPVSKLVGKFIEDKDQKNKLAQAKNLKVQAEDSTLTKIQKILLGLNLQLLLMLVQQLQKLEELISLMLEKFKSLLSWNKGQK